LDPALLDRVVVAEALELVVVVVDSVLVEVVVVETELEE